MENLYKYTRRQVFVVSLMIRELTMCRVRTNNTSLKCFFSLQQEEQFHKLQEARPNLKKVYKQDLSNIFDKPCLHTPVLELTTHARAFLTEYNPHFIPTLTARMTKDTNAAHSSCIWPSNWVIMSATGLLATVAKNDTAEIVIIELMKKYDIISTIVPAD